MTDDDMTELIGNAKKLIDMIAQNRITFYDFNIDQFTNQNYIAFRLYTAHDGMHYFPVSTDIPVRIDRDKYHKFRVILIIEPIKDSGTE